jgi:hypothetical protein
MPFAGQEAGSKVPRLKPCVLGVLGDAVRGQASAAVLQSFFARGVGLISVNFIPPSFDTSG